MLVLTKGGPYSSFLETSIFRNMRSDQEEKAKQERNPAE